MQLVIDHKVFPLRAPFVITGFTFTEHRPIWVSLRDGEYQGRGEGCGIYYQGDTQESMTAEIEAIRHHIEAGASREDLQDLLPPGGARNAVDCAMWDLECKREGATIWELLDITPKTLTTVATIGIGSALDMAARALELASFSQLKIKIDAEDPVGKLSAIRRARPDATLVTDVNQGWSRELLVELLPELEALGVSMIEQPLARGRDTDLDGVPRSIPIGADESCLNLSEYQAVSPHFEVVNIKLDKCGGLTEALAIAARAKADNKNLMVGNMTGSSLAMAPSYVVGQFCEVVDIDGPILLEKDIANGLRYEAGGVVSIPRPELWG